MPLSKSCAELLGWQPSFAANTYRTYANASIAMLGMIAAQSMKMPYAETMEQRLFAMLRMPNRLINNCPKCRPLVVSLDNARRPVP